MANGIRNNNNNYLDWILDDLNTIRVVIWKVRNLQCDGKKKSFNWT